MHDALHRYALALMLAVGLATLLAAGTDAAPTTALQHRQAMLLLLGATLALAPWIAPVRLAAVASGLLTKGAFLLVAVAGGAWPPAAWAELLQLAALAVAAALLLAEARREAQWNGVLPLRQEG